MSIVADQALQVRNSVSIHSHISAAKVFRGVDAGSVDLLSRRARLHHYARGETIFKRGERPEGVLLVAEGSLRLAVRSANGEEKVIALVEVGRCCASALAFLDRGSALEATALEQVTIVSIPAPAVLEAMQRDTELARRVVEHLSQRVLSLVDEVEGITLRRGLGRIAHYIESLTAERGPGAHAVRLPSTKTMIAARLGVAKETLSRLLHELVQRGVISVAGRDLYIRDRAALAALALGRANGNGNGSGRGGAQLDARE